MENELQNPAKPQASGCACGYAATVMAASGADGKTAAPQAAPAAPEKIGIDDFM